MKAKAVGKERSRAKGRRRGVVTVEYAMILVVFALPVIVGFIVAGAALVNNYTQMRNNVLHVGP